LLKGQTKENLDHRKYLMYKIGSKSNQHNITQLVATVNILQMILLMNFVINQWEQSLLVIMSIENKKRQLKHDLKMRIILKKNEN
jgi:hypothetical protein